MAALKCKMCGGDLVITPGSTVCECEYCGSKQTIPAADNEKKLTLFARANRLRFNSEFDKAAGVYESIVADFPEEAEAYWGLVLCKYGIEYVDDPATAKKVPTCHRSSFDSVLDDQNFDMACEYAEPEAKRLYREEAKAIETIRKGIIEVSGKEEPYDIFICYKETADDGNRTLDSVLAQDIYTALTEKGYRVFFSRITLEDKLGQEYEPYIFAALHSARIMLAVGTQFEYYDAVWVKNEWSRYLKLIEAGEKKTLIPCFKNLDPYDMPKEFAKLQAQDLGKVGATQDLLRGIEKILGSRQSTQSQPETPKSLSGPSVATLLQRGNYALEDKDWENARRFFDRVLDSDTTVAEAYLGMFMAKIKASDRTGAQTSFEKGNYTDDGDFKRARKYADAVLAAELDAWVENHQKRVEMIQRFEQKLSAFGHRKGMNGSHPMEWILLARDGNKALLLSKYAIDALSYQRSLFANLEWGSSPICASLNGSLYQEMFNAEEQKCICTIQITGDDGAVTSNKVFLLSKTEVQKYYPNLSARMCMPTSYAERRGAQASYNQMCEWWLRTVYTNSTNAVFVGADGSLNGGNIRTTKGVRPAVWVKVSEVAKLK